ncbi:MAG: hypothetical protein HYR62_04420 [Actinobacteria bacterium]|nr:hypothetical protein [Actinomycetota bacterium]MBI3686300.1 hypothetical protein [Actinomycetota bacterium]
MNVIGTARTSTTWNERRGLLRTRATFHELVFEDWTIDGTPLRELLAARPETPSRCRR